METMTLEKKIKELGPKAILVVAGLVVLLVGVVVFGIRSMQGPGSGLVRDVSSGDSVENSTVRDVFRVGGNAILVQDQVGSARVLVEVADLSSNGFVVIHEIVNGKPGTAVGASDLLERGGHENVMVSLDQSYPAGTTLMAVLHENSAGTRFNQTRDLVIYADGEPVGMRFTLFSR